MRCGKTARDLALLRVFVVERDAIVNYELDHARQLQRLRPDRYTPLTSPTS